MGNHIWGLILSSMAKWQPFWLAVYVYTYSIFVVDILRVLPPLLALMMVYGHRRHNNLGTEARACSDFEPVSTL